MNKQTLIEHVNEKAGIGNKAFTGRIIDTVFSEIKEALANGEKAQFVGFGSFEVRERAARKGHNPQTGEEIEIPATKVPAFKAGKAFKDAVK